VNKADLLGITPADQENELTFTTHPNLSAFRFFLDIICQELTKYALWPVRLRQSAAWRHSGFMGVFDL